MTNTIPNVPRQLLERAATSIEQRMCIQCEGVPCCMPESLNTLSDIHAILSAPSPAGVDGLEVVAWQLGCQMMTGEIGWKLSWHQSGAGVCARLKGDEYEQPLCRLSDAQAIIDGLRGEVGAQRVKTCTALKERNDAREERDQQAQRIGELEGLLRESYEDGEYFMEEGLLERIDAALTAVCAAAPNIATTSEHSSQPERDPCPMCIKGGICNTPTCGRLRAMPKAY